METKKREETKRNNFAICKSTENLKKYVKSLNSKFSHMGDVVAHIVLENKADEPFILNMDTYEGEAPEEEEAKEMRKLINKQFDCVC